MILKSFVIVFLIFVAVVFLIKSFGGSEKISGSQQQADTAKIRIKNQEFLVEIADTDEERIKGLSGRESLPEGRGMLFVFDQPGMYGFWMKDMLFSIDIIWLSEEGRVVHIVKNASPESFPEVFYPAAEAKYVLELPAGTAERLGLQIGDEVFLPQEFLGG